MLDSNLVRAIFDCEALLRRMLRRDPDDPDVLQAIRAIGVLQYHLSLFVEGVSNGTV